MAIPRTLTPSCITWSYHTSWPLVVLTTEWLPWLQTNWRGSGYVLFTNCITQPERKLPDHHWSCIFERGHTCMYHRACNNNHYLADIVTTEHLRENHHKIIIFLRCSCSDLLTDVMRVVICKVWFGLRLLMQLTSNAKNKLLITTLPYLCWVRSTLTISHILWQRL